MLHKDRLARLRPKSWVTRLLATAGILAGVSTVGDINASPATFTFVPPNPGWVVALNGGTPVIDIEGDTPGGRDIVGDATNPVLFIASDTTHMYFRLRVDSDPLQSPTNIGPFGWGCLINTDADLTTFEYSTIVDGVNNPDQIHFYRNTVTTTPNDPTEAPDMPSIVTTLDPLAPAVGHAQSILAGSNFGGNADYFIDWAVDLAPLLAAGFNPANPANYYCGSANNGSNLGADCSGGSACLPLDVEFTDPIACGPEGCAICGDGQKGASEGCDDGNTTNGDGCNSMCLIELGLPCAGTSPACASGFCDPAGDICACDASADCPVGQVCATAPNPNQCVAPGCGNSVLEGGEGCDDGNLVNGDGCTMTCLLELGEPCMMSGLCDSGFCDPSGNLCACDQNADCPMPNVCNTVSNPNTCVAPGCGNSVLEAGEGCDDGNTMANDGCNAVCLLELGQPCAGMSPSCGSGFCDPTGNICACDEMADCPSGQQCNTVLDPNQCVPAGCGNGIIEAGEGCDDNNLNNGDGCNAQCLLELGQPCAGNNMVCASTFCDPAGNICACDEFADCPGIQLCNTTPNPNICVDPGCGNNVLEAGEACDDGNLMNGDGCNAVCLREIDEPCTLAGQCASGFCDPANNACACDQSVDCPAGTLCNTVNDPNICVPPGCGNFVLEAGEACEDGNLTNGDGCNSVCLLELGESCLMSTECASGLCDPANNTCACDEHADCPMGKLCNEVADPNLCVDPGCGNFVLEATEGCDDGNMVTGDGCNAVCLKEIGQACTMSTECASGLCDPANNTCACDEDADCSGGFLCNMVNNPNLCVAPGCGNNVLEATEACDDGNLNDNDGCNSMCLREIGQPCTMSTQCASTFCDPANNTCACDQDADCSGGQLCNVVAAPNVCVNPGCANNVLEANEGCDDGNTTPGDGCNAVCLLELGESCPASDKCASNFCDPANNACACDENADCSGGQLCNTVANPNMCVAPGCGNNVLEATEACDDGNTTDGDGCNNMCLREIGEPCNVNTQCASSFCDATNNTCACDQDADCSGGQLCNTVANPNMCVAPGCGNNVLEATEGCDDGNTTNGDGCNSVCLKEIGQTCTLSNTCASGFCDPANNTCACDQDADCSGGQLCNTVNNPNVCVNPGCGNFVLETGEGCDDGNTTDNDGCNAVCLKELGQTCSGNGVCASNFCDLAGNICACDMDTDCPSGQQCNTTLNPNQCVPAGCGNGILNAGEGCDDSNMNNGDGCNAQCLIELTFVCTVSTGCASGFCDPSMNTCACDQDADCSGGQLCNMVSDPNTCVAPGCGNFVLEMNEGCDDGNTMAGDGCNGSCLLEIGQMCTLSGQCASGFCDSANNTCACDQDADCAGGQLCNTVATPNVCVNPGCGNFVLEATEGCDDGNTNNGDGCNSVCLLEIGQTCTLSNTCASGFCDPADNTCACDQDADCSGGQLCNTVATPNVCVNPGCGNFVLEATEGCDDGNTTPGDGCDGSCLLELGEPCPMSQSCASSFCDPADNTCACDQDADCSGGQLCNIVAAPNVCVNPGCGNNVLEATEGCDDGNTTPGDGCNATCLLEIGEPCPQNDKCASNFCDTADNTCACDGDEDCNGTSEECQTGLDPNECVPAGCGNGVVSGTEGCDDGNLNNGDGCTAQCLIELGLPCGASPACESGFCDPAGSICACDQDADCSGGQLCNIKDDPNVCVAPGCGNDVLELNEGCDDGNTTPGDGCNDVCLLEIGQPCMLSGNCASGACNNTTGTCECDEDADCPAGNVCDTNADPNACVPTGCGNGVLEIGEGCDDGNTTDGDGCNATCSKELTQPCVDGTECDSGNCDGTTNTCVCEVNADCPTGQVCDTNADPNECVAAGCGNGVVETGEGCDDGNTTDGDGCTAVCSKELTQPCVDGTECDSGNCDGSTNTCVCEVDADCPMGEVCDTTANPHACVPPSGCNDDTDCAGMSLVCDEPSRTCVECTVDGECKDGVCDEAKFTCVGCLVDADCPDEGTCDSDTRTCIPKGIIVEGGGIICATSTTSSNDNNLPFALLGLLALGMTRRRRR